MNPPMDARTQAMMQLAGKNAPPEDMGGDLLGQLSGLLQDQVSPECLNKVMRLVQADMGNESGGDDGKPSAPPPVGE